MQYSVNGVLSVCCTRCMLYSVHAVLGACCTRCMLYSVYTVLGVNSRSWHGEIERDDLTSSSLVMVELRTRKRKMRGYGGNHHEKQGLKIISCVSQFTIPDTAGTSPDPACNYTDTRSSQPDPASHTLITHIRSYPPHRSHLPPPSLSFSSTSLQSSQNTKLSHPSVSRHVMIMSWHQVLHTPSTAYTEYSIHPRLFVFPSFS